MKELTAKSQLLLSRRAIRVVWQVEATNGGVLFLKISQIYWKTPAPESFLYKSCRASPYNCIKKILHHRCFPVNLSEFLKSLLRYTPLNDYFCTSLVRWLQACQYLVIHSCEYGRKYKKFGLWRELSLVVNYELIPHLYPKDSLPSNEKSSMSSIR